MHVHMRPVLFQPVPVARPVQRVKTAPVQTAVVGRVAARSGEGGQRGSFRPPRDPGHGEQAEEDRSAPRDPGATLAATLALLAIDRAADARPADGGDQP